MSDDKLLAMARGCGDHGLDGRGREWFEFDSFGLARLEAAIRADEREACAKVCEEIGECQPISEAAIAADCAAAIRARSEP